MKSGVCIGVSPWKQAVMAETGGDFLMMKVWHAVVEVYLYILIAERSMKMSIAWSIS